MYEHKDVHQGIWHPETLCRRSMIIFLIVSSDLHMLVLDIWVKTEAEAEQHQVVSWISWKEAGQAWPAQMY